MAPTEGAWQTACWRIKTWINRYLPGYQFFRSLNRWLHGHYNY